MNHDKLRKLLVSTFVEAYILHQVAEGIYGELQPANRKILEPEQLLPKQREPMDMTFNPYNMWLGAFNPRTQMTAQEQLQINKMWKKSEMIQAQGASNAADNDKITKCKENVYQDQTNSK